MKIGWGDSGRAAPSAAAVCSGIKTPRKKVATDSGQPLDDGLVATAGMETGRVGTQTAEVAAYLDTGQLLDGFFTATTGMQESALARPIYHDIFHNDICGTVLSALAAGAASELNWSQGELTSAEFEKFNLVREKLPERNMFVRLTTDCLYCGAGAGLFFTREDEERDITIPYGFYHYNPVTMNVTPMPFYNCMPMVQGRVEASELSSYAAILKDKTLASYVAAVMGDDLKTILEDSYANPENLLAMLRIPLGKNETVSMLRRVLSEWFFNKNLYRGTLENSIRRINGVAHISVAMPNGADSQPQLADLEYYGQRFHEAAQDPTGAMVVTRDGVTVSSVMDANQFWSYEQSADASLSRRLKLMGVPEGLATVDFSQDAVAGVSAAVALFQGIRDMLSEQVLDRRYVPQLSIYARNYKADGLAKYDLDASDKPNYIQLLATHANMSDLLKMPKYSFSNSLEMPPDPQIFDMWDKLKERGIPMPLSILSHLAKVDLNSMLTAQEDDLALRKRMQDYFKKVEAFTPKPDDGGGGFSGMSASVGPRIVQEASGDYRVDRSQAQLQESSQNMYTPEVKDALYRVLKQKG